MSLVNIETFNQNGTIVFTNDNKIVIDTDNKTILIICTDVATTPAGVFEKPFIMQADNDFRVPIVNADGEPVIENPEAPELEQRQASIGEYDMLKLLTDNKIITLPEAVASAILRRKGITNDPYVFIQA